MTSTTTRGLLYSSLHRFNNALENLKSFQKEKDIIENIGYLDDFFSNFRSTTFVLQQSLAHTSYRSHTKLFVKNILIISLATGSETHAMKLKSRLHLN